MRTFWLHLQDSKFPRDAQQETLFSKFLPKQLWRQRLAEEDFQLLVSRLAYKVSSSNQRTSGIPSSSSSKSQDATHASNLSLNNESSLLFCFRGQHSQWGSTRQRSRKVWFTRSYAQGGGESRRSVFDLHDAKPTEVDDRLSGSNCILHLSSFWIDISSSDSSHRKSKLDAWKGGGGGGMMSERARRPTPNLLSFSISLTHSLSLFQDLMTTEEAISLSVTVYMVVQGIAPLILGSSTDRIGRRPIYLVCLVSDHFNFFWTLSEGWTDILTLCSRSYRSSISRRPLDSQTSQIAIPLSCCWDVFKLLDHPVWSV